MDFTSIILEHSHPLQPVATGVSPRVRPLKSISAVLFDIYGTLLISSSGDVESDPSIDAAQAFSQSLAATIADTHDKIEAQTAIKLFHNAIAARHQELRESGTEFPEVDIREIWKRVWHEFERREWIDGTDNFDRVTEQFAVEFETRVNPVWPMPGAKEVIERIAQSKRLGLISNAQFITLELFPALLGKSIPDLGFDPSLVFYSYRFEQAKPGVQLYEMAADALGEQNIAPENVLYVGNDMLKDIAPARQVGFKTALFAGDKRSLRTHEGNPHLAGVEADLVLTELSQILESIDD